MKNKDFYLNEIGVLDWLEDKSEIQIHRFSNRKEYKKNYILHREDGPAIEFFNGSGNQYYVNGKLLTQEEFKNFNRVNLIKKMTK
jgi:antitoxin component YwqK of YwqJK toxin-antitoxin module